jgi:hypothetical protein
VPQVSDVVEHIPIHSFGFEEGLHDLFSHFVELADAVESYKTGNVVISLCGKEWVPSRDPDSFPTCGTCVSILKDLSGEEIQ